MDIFTIFYYNKRMNSSQTKIKLIIGLGNPDLPAGRHGKKYENTYHNAGHLFIDFLTESLKLKAKSLKTDVYMNQSGAFVYKTIKRNGIKPENLAIAHDDSDIYLGNYKLSFDRSSAGHHGIESVIKALGTKSFWRLRIGIRPLQKEKEPRLKADRFVLKKITASNKKILDDVFKKIAKELFEQAT